MGAHHLALRVFAAPCSVSCGDLAAPCTEAWPPGQGVMGYRAGGFLGMLRVYNGYEGYDS